MILLALLLAGICAAPFLREHYRPKMTDGRRGSAPGKFVELSQGVTHYHLSGSASGPLVVLVHGLTTPSFVWAAIARALATRGYRVLAYDLYGRGYSDRPDGLQDKAFFLTQLTDLLDHLEVESPFTLVGYSMGGAICAGFTAAHPTRVERLALVAPAGMQVPDSTALRVIRDRGLIGKWLMLLIYPSRLRSGIEAERDLPSAVPGITDLQEEQLTYQGFIPAVLSSLRGLLARPLEGEHLAIARDGLPVLALWGEDDTVIPASAMGQLAAWNRRAVHEVIADAGHGLPYTHADPVIAALLGFLPPPPTNT